MKTVIIDIGYSNDDFIENRKSLLAKIKGDEKYSFYKRYNDFELSFKNENEIVQDVKKGLNLNDEVIKVEFI